MAVIEKAHTSWIAPRRQRQLCCHAAALLARGGRVLDVGCGDGHLTKLISEARPDLRLTGVEVFVRPHVYVPIVPFDGTHLPFEDGEFEDALLVDVVHHAGDPVALLRDIRRVCHRHLIIKDHLLQGPLAFATLAFMDFAGNPRHGVRLPHNYWRKAQWLQVFREEGWRIEVWREDLGLYGKPFDLAFGRRLHFMAKLRRA